MFMMSKLIRKMMYYVFGIFNGSSEEQNPFVYLEDSKNIQTDMIGKSLTINVKPKSFSFCFQARVEDRNKIHVLQVGMALE